MLNAKRLASALLGVWPLFAWSNDNLVAQRLYEAGRYAEAAEIYTDPAWKGIALYRSEQWWRAAEAFVRANDPDSLFNLGNAYVKLGYYALALEAYQSAIALRENFTDAQFNAQLMRELLAETGENDGQSGLQRQGQELDRVESESSKQGNQSPADDNENSEPTDKPPGESSSANENRADSADGGREGGSGETDEQHAQQPENNSPPTGNVAGTQSLTEAQDNPAGGSETESETADAQAAGQRSKLDAEQATEQWLNQINHDTARFLQRRIALEMRRRQASGEAAPAGGSQW